MRITGWEDALARVIEKHAAEPLKYGKSDCGQLVADAVEAVTGQDLFKDYRSYTTEAGAARVLRKAGCENLGDLFAKYLPLQHPFFAKRGDIGVIEQNGNICAGVFTGNGFVGKAEQGVFYMGIDAVKQAYTVD